MSKRCSAVVAVEPKRAEGWRRFVARRHLPGVRVQRIDHAFAAVHQPQLLPMPNRALAQCRCQIGTEFPFFNTLQIQFNDWNELQNQFRVEK